jgi:dTDP-4-dehydrorhamnose reductase
VTRAVVFGGSGMLGHRVVREGRRRGHAVLGLARAQADLTDPERLAWWTERFRPEVVFNCAAMTVVDDCEGDEERATAVNGAGAGHVAAAARRAGARCLHVSTDYVFDGAGTEPYRTSDATGPISAYGRSKLAGEEAVLAAGRSDGGTTVVRTSWLFGPDGPAEGPSFVKTMLRLIDQGRTPLRVVDDQVGAPTYTPYLAGALWDLAEIGADIGSGRWAGSKVDGVFHYQNREAISWYGFAREIVRSWTPDSEGSAAVDVVPVTTEEFPRPAPRPAYSVLDVGRFEELTGRPVETWRTGLGIHLDHLRTHRPARARAEDPKTREENEESR